MHHNDMQYQCMLKVKTMRAELANTSYRKSRSHVISMCNQMVTSEIRE